MVSSMTGFANAGGDTGVYSWTFEVKSVNGRGLDLRLALPTGCDGLETAIRTQFKEAFVRGNMQASLQLKDRSGSAQVRIDTGLLTSLARTARLADRRSIGRVQTRTSELLALRGVLTGETSNSSISQDDETGRAILKTVEATLHGLRQARDREGEALKSVLLRVLSDMAAECEKARLTSDAQPEQMKARLRDRVEKVLEDSKISPERLEQEIALLITKADVTEETDRLSAHIDEALRLLNLGEPVGRKLDFLSQEMLREANTLGSKSASLDMTRHSLALKTLIDQFKEQAANVE